MTLNRELREMITVSMENVGDLLDLPCHAEPLATASKN